MRRRKLWFAVNVPLVVLTMALMLSAVVAASKYKVLHVFKGSADGTYPGGNLIFDAVGNLYGATGTGGVHLGGAIFKLRPNSNGTWSESLVYSFCSLTNCADGQYPNAGLIFDGAGNLYGTTGSGGVTGVLGTVFELTPTKDGSWKESVLYSFLGDTDGWGPSDGLVFDAAGNLYGTTELGGGTANCEGYGCGTVFKLHPKSDGSWHESVLYRFSGGADGSLPFAQVIFGAGGNLYSTTNEGGAFNQGTVFKLAPKADGSWTESVLHSFTGRDGANPYSSVIFDAGGRLYGTTFGGGTYAHGTVFKLTQKSDGSWKESVLHQFHGSSLTDPSTGGLTFDTAGDLYGTAQYGGPANYGGVFKLALQSGGGWAFSVLRSFKGTPAAYPVGSLILDKAGNIYGTASNCGNVYECSGVAFEITP